MINLNFEFFFGLFFYLVENGNFIHEGLAETAGEALWNSIFDDFEYSKVGEMEVD